MFKTNIELSNNKVTQITGDTITLSGNTVIGENGSLKINSSILENNDVANKKYVDDIVFQYSVDSGTTNNYQIEPTIPITEYIEGQSFLFKANSGNTSGSTISISGLASIPIQRRNGSALQENDIPSKSINQIVIDEISNDNFVAQLLSLDVNSGGGVSDVVMNNAVIENVSKNVINVTFPSSVELTQSGWSIDVNLNGVAKTITSLSGGSTSWDFTMSSDAEDFADVIQLKYNDVLGNSTDSNGDFLQSQELTVLKNITPVLYYDKSIVELSGSNASLQMDTQQSYILPNSWTFITWCKPPQTITNLEAIFGTLLVNPGSTGLTNFHLWSLETNAEDSNYFDGFTRIYRSTASTIVASPILTSFSSNIGTGFQQNSSRDKVMFAITAFFNSLDSTWKVSSFMNGLPQNTFENLDSIPSTMAFNWLSDRGVASRFGKSEIAGARFYPNVEMTPAQMAIEFNRGYGRSPQFPVLFDVVADTPQLDGSDYYIPDLSGMNNRVRLDTFTSPAISDTGFTNNISTGDTIFMNTILYAGNSIVNGQGSGAEPNDFPSKCINLLGNYPFFGVKNGVGGIETPEMIINQPTEDDIYYSEVYDKNILVFLEGGNHLVGGASSGDVYQAMYDYCALAKSIASSRSVIICTILPRDTTLPGIPNTFDVERIGINDLIKNQLSPPWDGIADIGSDATIGNLTDAQDSLKYPDGIHPSNTTNDVIAQIVRDQIILL